MAQSAHVGRQTGSASAQSWRGVSPMDRYLLDVWSPASNAECVLIRPGFPGDGGKAPTVPRGLLSLGTTLCVLGWHLSGLLLSLGVHGGLTTV